MVNLVFLGTAGAGGVVGRVRNCILVDNGDTRVMLDFGEGCGWRLEEYGLTLCDLDLVYISHLHADHYCGLFDSVVRASVHECRSLRIGAAGGVFKELGRALDILPKTISIDINAIEVPMEGMEIGSFFIKPVKTKHSIESYGLLIVAGDKKILYTADTSLDTSLLRHYSGVDVLIHEVSLPSSRKHLAKSQGHTSVDEVHEIRKYLSEKTLLVIVHTTIESYKELQKKQLPPNTIIPGDHTIISI